jgi:hypothetical protein
MPDQNQLALDLLRNEAFAVYDQVFVKAPEGGDQLVADIRAWGALSVRHGDAVAADVQAIVARFVAEAINEKMERMGLT